MASVRATALGYLDSVRLTRFHVVLFTGIALAQILDGWEVAAFAFAIPGIGKELHIAAGQIGLAAGVQNLGLLLGALVAGNLADRIGRRWPFTLALLFYPAGALITALAPNLEVLILGRLIAGLGIGGQWPITFTLVAEFTPTRWRSKAMPGMLLMTGLGMIVAALVGVFVVVPHGWRLGMALGVVPAVLAIWVRVSSPESVRYLLGAGKIREAHAVIQRIARSAGDDVEVVGETEAARREVAASTAGTTARGRMVARYLGPLVALTFTIFFFNVSGYGALTWIPSLLVAHGISTLNSFTVVLISNSVAPVFALILATGTIDIAPQRRFALGFIGIGGGVAFATLGAAFLLGWPLFWVVVTQIAFSVSYTAVNVFYYTLGTELFPTAVRAQTVAYATGFGRLGAVVGPPLLGVLLAAGLGVDNVIFLFATPMAIAGLICLAFLRRPTRFMSLEEASGVDEPAQASTAVSVE
ncbi:MAG: MFS transporter [Candidatus Dormibacteraeota bacterium]|nr:MFS transporter [Candidatus Dormibacteraeota bacterium]